MTIKLGVIAQEQPGKQLLSSRVGNNVSIRYNYMKKNVYTLIDVFVHISEHTENMNTSMQETIAAGG